MPVERLHQALQVFQQSWQPHAFLYRSATPDALDDAQIGVMGNKASVVGERLNHREPPRCLQLHQQLPFAEPERGRCSDQFVCCGGTTHAGACGRDGPLHEHRKLRDGRQIIYTPRHNGGGLRNTDRVQGAPRLDLVLYAAQRSKMGHHCRNPKPATQGR